ncbi:formyltetrahydrofolate deformylase [Corynebacterium alimapuense]|uniref:Formyltetrahydrofolate deformylase n=1 Tax=Corynebacterium alimapuense TaxID=1576874 RepID=A0A3M8K8Z6_9CORY|nr:formyltetrahydrofolate deformylase [Corynebacterium alimapuense]RNE49691.1 formyltetrahydrofolate deformylase [Corynebacterium alimapuense]
MTPLNIDDPRNRPTGSTRERQFVLTLGCPDDTGIVARLATFIAGHGGLITEAAYFADPQNNWFFTRQAIRAESMDLSIEQLREAFLPVAQELGPRVQWQLSDTAVLKKVVLLVSREGHCLHDLLGRVAENDYPMEVVAVVGNHENLAYIAENHGVPFHLVPFPKDAVGKRRAFEELAEIVNGYEPDAIVLARFMQVLPPDFCEMWAGKVLNIHHSFLPSFMGARPYHQAHKRGVKLIGATCHYATPDLDDGPIIEQDVIRVTHKDSPEEMQRLGRDAEKRVLARGLRYHLEDRVLVYGNRTVVFD